MTPEKKLEAADPALDEDLTSTYGEPTSEEPVPAALAQRQFRPWHHPVKQLVRSHQWAKSTRRLLSDRAEKPKVLHYFTLPGADLFDVTVLCETCSPFDAVVKYFGFDVGAKETDGGVTAGSEAAWFRAESALRQAGRITSDALILPDRLEDIAVSGSQASDQLNRQPAFDVINIDACDHLAYIPRGRDQNTFDALLALFKHQMTRARLPWLLFLTTRVEPTLAGQPALNFQKAITDNLAHSPQTFGAALCKAIEADPAKIAAALSEIWTTHDVRFLKLYSIGLGKFVLQFFHGQPNLPAAVELISSYCYRVHHDEPDMLALALRITPEQPRVFNPSVGGAALIPVLEGTRGANIALRAEKIWDLDRALDNPELLGEAVTQTTELLSSANYDINAWRAWLAMHPRRPIQIS